MWGRRGSARLRLQEASEVDRIIARVEERVRVETGDSGSTAAGVFEFLRPADLLELKNSTQAKALSTDAKLITFACLCFSILFRCHCIFGFKATSKVTLRTKAGVICN